MPEEQIALLRSLRWLYLVIQVCMGFTLIFDPSIDNRFTGFGLDISNIWLGAAILLVTGYVWWLHPPFYTLPMWAFLPIILSVQRMIMIAFLPGRAKFAWWVYAMALLPFIRIAYWAKTHGINDDRRTNQTTR